MFLVTGCLQGCLLAMGIYFEVQARKSRRTEGEGVRPQQSTVTEKRANFLQARATCVAGYIPNGNPETDDEGGVIIEDGEETPLLNDSRKLSRTPAPKKKK